VTPEELRKLLQSEDERTEWKQSAKDANDILHAVYALANDLGDRRSPGFLLIGVAKNGKVVGIDARGSKLDEAQQNLANLLGSSKIGRRPHSTSKFSSTRGRWCSSFESNPTLYRPSSK
jgi:hypothetical protein